MKRKRMHQRECEREEKILRKTRESNIQERVAGSELKTRKEKISKGFMFQDIAFIKHASLVSKE